MNNIEHLIVARQPVVYTAPRPTVVYTSPRPVYHQPNVVYTSSTNNIGLYIFFFILLIIIIMFFFTPIIYV